jgi:putative phosphoesterase
VEIAIISDIHGNLEALSTVLQDIDKRVIEYICCTGDIVGYYPNPLECIELVKKRCKHIILGNHDEVVTSKNFEEHISWFNHIAADALIWTRFQLLKSQSSEYFHFLENLMPQKEITMEERKILLAHGTPEEKWEYFLQNPTTNTFTVQQEVRLRNWLKRWDFVVIGHTHQPFVYKFRKKMVLNPGSVGQPRDGNSKASYAIVTITKSSIDAEIIRLAYDIKKVCGAILENNLHEYLCERLFNGR